MDHETAEEAAERVVLRLTNLVLSQVIAGLDQERGQLADRLQLLPAISADSAMGRLDKAIREPELPIGPPLSEQQHKPKPAPPKPLTAALEAPEPFPMAAADPPKPPSPWKNHGATTQAPPRKPVQKVAGPSAATAVLDTLGGNPRRDPRPRSMEEIAAVSAERLTQLVFGLIAKGVQQFTHGPRAETRPSMHPEMKMELKPT